VEGRSLGSRSASDVTDIQEIGMSLLPPIKVGKLQTALHTKAKNSPGYRFYALYDKLYRRDILEWAFLRCLQNGGAPGVDAQSFADIEAYGEERWLDELTEELRNETYRPRPVRRVFIPKGDGKLRPLGIPIFRSYCTSLQRRWGLIRSKSTAFGRVTRRASSDPACIPPRKA
jgi:RNA-directed DNA polymerase